MMSTGRTVKSWVPQQSSLKRDDVQYDAAKASAPSLPAQGGSGGVGSANKGGQDTVGDVLNRIADPTGTDAAKKAVRKPSNELNKDDFLKLMLAQMKNQDPMNPMQSHEMAAQLAQFTSLEQLFNVNQNLEGLKKQADPSIKFQALSFLGKSVKADSRQILKDDGPHPQDLRFNLLDGAQDVTIKISDEIGNDVQTIKLSNLKKGLNSVSWNGLDSDNRPTKGGRYFASFEAIGNNGKKIGVETATHGVITGVNYTKEGPMLLVGNQRVRLQDVQEIVDDSNGAGAATQQPQQQQPAQAPTTLMPGQGPVPNTPAATDQSQLTKVNKDAEKKDETNFNPKASLPLEVDGNGIKTDGPFRNVAKGG